MTIETFSLLLLVGGALTGLWLAIRLARFTPRSFAGAVALLVSTVVFAAVSPAVLRVALGELPFAAAVMLGAFPALVAIFAGSALVLRYFVSAIRSEA